MSARRPPPLRADPVKINGLGHDESMKDLVVVLTSAWPELCLKAEGHAACSYVKNPLASVVPFGLLLGCFQKEGLLGPESRTTIPVLRASTSGSCKGLLINHPRPPGTPAGFCSDVARPKLRREPASAQMFWMGRPGKASSPLPRAAPRLRFRLSRRMLGEPGHGSCIAIR